MFHYPVADVTVRDGQADEAHVELAIDDLIQGGVWHRSALQHKVDAGIAAPDLLGKRGRILLLEAPAKPRRTRPDSPAVTERTAACASSTSARTLRAGPKSLSPASVSVTERVFRLKSLILSCFSSCWIR